MLESKGFQKAIDKMPDLKLKLNDLLKNGKVFHQQKKILILEKELLVKFVKRVKTKKRLLLVLNGNIKIMTKKLTLLVDSENLLKTSFHGNSSSYFEEKHIGGIKTFLESIRKVIMEYSCSKIILLWVSVNLLATSR